MAQPVAGNHWPDDTIATATLLRDALAWADDAAPEPYPLAQGCQDAALGFAIEKAIKAQRPVEVPAGPWA